MISQMCKRKWRTFGTRSGVIARGMMHLVGGPTSKMALSQSAFTPWHVHRRRFKLLWQPLQVLTQVQQMRPRPSCRRRVGPGHRNRLSVLQEFFLYRRSFRLSMRSNRKRRQKRRWMDLWMDFFFLDFVWHTSGHGHFGGWWRSTCSHSRHTSWLCCTCSQSGSLGCLSWGWMVDGGWCWMVGAGRCYYFDWYLMLPHRFIEQSTSNLRREAAHMNTAASWNKLEKFQRQRYYWCIS